MGKPMSIQVKSEKEKIRGQIRSFLMSHGIPYQEDEEHIRIKGRLFSADLMPYAGIDINFSEYKYLLVEEQNEDLVLAYRLTYPESYYTEIRIQKSHYISVNPKIYFMDSILVFWF